MKTLIIILSFFCLLHFVALGQTNKNYIDTKRDDGLISRMYEPQTVSNKNGMQIALGLITCQAGNYVYVVLSFGQKTRMLKGMLALRLGNEELLRFEPENIQKTDLGQSKGVLGLFRLPANYAEKLKRNKVTHVSLVFDDGSLSTYTVETNGDVLIKQFKQIQ
jgi:hypothetical protein